MKTQELKVDIEEGELVIRIGVDILKVATEASPEFVGRYGGCTIEVIHPHTWATEVKNELIREKYEDGTTLIHQMLDEAFKTACESGAEGVSLIEEKE